MALPNTTVEIAFDLSQVVPDFFTLDDPVRGILTGGTVTSIYPLAGDILQDVSADTRSVTISRGRSRELEQYRVGQASVVLYNREREYDPTDDQTPYLNQILPRKDVRISFGNAVAFVGIIEDWSFNYDVSGDSTTSVSAVDGFALLARQDIGGFSQGTATTNERIDAVLNASGVAFPPAKRDLDTSTLVLAAGTVADNTNALAYLQQIEQVEAGDFYISANGLATFHSRLDGTVQPSLTSNVVFTDEPQGVVTVGSATEIRVPYVSIGMQLGMDQVRNQVTATHGTATFVKQDTDSQDEYGAVALTLDGNLLNSSSDAENLAQYLVNRYAKPVVRFDQVTVDLSGVQSAQMSSLLGLDLTDVVRVRFQPNKINDRVERIATVEGVEHQVSPGRHTVIFRFSAAPGS